MPSWNYAETGNSRSASARARWPLRGSILTGEKTVLNWRYSTKKSQLSPGRGMMMYQPRRLLSGPGQPASILGRFTGSEPPRSGTSYATVSDFCESVDALPQISPLDGDLKNVQRP